MHLILVPGIPGSGARLPGIKCCLHLCLVTLTALLPWFTNLQSGDKNSTYRKLSGNKCWQCGAWHAGSTLQIQATVVIMVHALPEIPLPFLPHLQSKLSSATPLSQWSSCQPDLILPVRATFL